jgi:hypothetical protein
MQRVLDYLAAWVPAGWGNRNQVEVPTPAVAHLHQNSATANLRSNANITAKNILKAWGGHKFNSKLKDIYDCELKDCVIDVREWLDPLTSDDPEAVGCLIDLEPLRRQLAQDPVLNTQITDDHEELFLPSSIYVRQEMKGIFNLFCRDVNLLQQNNNNEDGAEPFDAPWIVKPFKKKTILLGSPGVGKSILCFLAALYRSQSTVTIYIRRTTVSGEHVSVFIMFPEDGERENGKVRCLFTRILQKQYLTELFGLKAFLEENLLLSRIEYYLFLDGPQYNKFNLRDTLEGEFDYLCTSAGYPDFKDEEEDNSRVWCLNGWTQDEAEAAFVQMHGDRDIDEVRRKAREAYALCGGKIRQMCRAFNNYEKMRERWNLVYTQYHSQK